MSVNPPLIDLANIERTFSVQPPVHAVRNINLTISQGEYVSIEGPSGSGKSTLLNLLGLLDRPSAGVYTLDGLPVTNLTDRELTAIRGERIGFVFQSFNLLPYRSALENVELGLLYRSKASNRRSAAAVALEKMGLSNRASFPPTRLSGGEQQRVAIARAIVGGPSVLLCDEPTGNLDSRTSEEILDVFSELWRSGITLVVVTHDPSVTARAQRMLSMSDGQLVS